MARIKVNEINLPHLHPAQEKIVNNLKRFNVLCAGRRFGKNVVLIDIIVRALLQGQRVAYLEPTYPMMIKVWQGFISILDKTIINYVKSERSIKVNTSGTLDLYSLASIDNIRGKSYDLVALNECAQYENLKNDFEAAILPTLIDTGGTAILTSTPKADRASTVFFKDLFERGQSPDEKLWQSFHYTSYDNPHLDRQGIDEMKREMTRDIYRQEILAEFVDRDDTIIKLSDIQYYDPKDMDLKMGNTIMGIDLAISEKSTADYTAIAILNFQNDKGYIVDVVKDRINFRKIIELIKQTAKKYQPAQVVIEDVAFQRSVIETLQVETQLNIQPRKPITDKISRFQPLAVEFQNNNIYINKYINENIVTELLNFPESEHDDVVDALSYAYLGKGKDVFFEFF